MHQQINLREQIKAFYLACKSVMYFASVCFPLFFETYDKFVVQYHFKNNVVISLLETHFNILDIILSLMSFNLY